MPSVHAVRSASGSKRWMACPGSINMEHGRPNNSSEAALLGTAAHALGEACLLDKSNAWEWVGGYVRLDPSEEAVVYRPATALADSPGDRTMIVPTHASEEGLPPKGARDFPIDADMADAVQVYLDAVREELERLGPDAELQVEQQFDLSWLIGFDYDFRAEDTATLMDELYVSPSGIYRAKDGPFEGRLVHSDGRICHGPMFGTNDASILLMFEHLTVMDYKHGQGVVVEVEDNSQELYYALGCAKKVDWAFETLDLVIVQPRARHVDGGVRRWSTTKSHLKAFEASLREAAIATEDPDATLAAGGHCQFCKAASVCPQLREESFNQAGVDFGDGFEEPTMLTSGPEDTDEDLELRLKAIPLMNAFIRSVETEALRRLRETETGEACFGKLVRKRSNRAFRTDLTEPDPESGEDVPVNVVDKLVEAGFPKEMLFGPPKQLSPTQTEKLRPPELMLKLKSAGVKAPAAFIKGLVAEYAFKPEGGITMAPLSDPRDAVAPSTAAEADFANEPEEDQSL